MGKASPHRAIDINQIAASIDIDIKKDSSLIDRFIDQCLFLLFTMPRAYGDDLRFVVLYQHHLGSDANEIASLFGIRKPTVYRYLAQSPDVSNRYSNCGSRLLTENERLDIVSATIEYPFFSANQIRRYLNLDPQAINAVLRKAGYPTCHSAKKTKMSAIHHQRRIEWCTLYQDIDWNRCIFADEASFSSEKDGVKLVKRPANTRYKKECLNLTSLCSRKLVSAFGLISKRASGQIIRLDSRLN